MSSAVADRAFNLEAWLELEAVAFAAVEGRVQAKLARQEVERIKDESIAALFEADALLSPRIARRTGDATTARQHARFEYRIGVSGIQAPISAHREPRLVPVETVEQHATQAGDINAPLTERIIVPMASTPHRAPIV
jgi:hypothetical protein